jgi:hypothetical protein
VFQDSIAPHSDQTWALKALDTRHGEGSREFDSTVSGKNESALKLVGILFWRRRAKELLPLYWDSSLFHTSGDLVNG